MKKDIPTSLSNNGSSDLTFITNEQDRSLADRFRVLLGNNTRAFDCLVGKIAKKLY